jgi:uncharacterized protein (TIGR03067 family)
MNVKTGIYLGLLAIAFLAIPWSATGQGKSAALDVAKLEGTWDYLSGVKNGQKFDKEHFKDQMVIITKDKLTLKGEATFVMKYEIDAKATPAVIKLLITESPFGDGAKAIGIVELNGDNLKICYAPEGKDAPKTFESKEGSMTHYFELKRAKKS